MYSRLNEVLEIFQNMFPNKSKSWIKRCVTRLPTIKQISRNVWFLRCLPKLGDRRPYYIVVYDDKKGRYNCTCYDEFSPWGERRRREVCSHVGAVILAKLLGQEYLRLIQNEHNNTIWRKRDYKKSTKKITR